MLLLRCMTTRRDNPDSALWRLAVEAFNRVLVDHVTKSTDGAQHLGVTKPVRTRIWKEIADVYEIFLVGYCGRALSSNSLSMVALEADESLEMTILNTLGDIVLKLPIDTPLDVSFLPIILCHHIFMPAFKVLGHSRTQYEYFGIYTYMELRVISYVDLSTLSIVFNLMLDLLLRGCTLGRAIRGSGNQPS